MLDEVSEVFQLQVSSKSLRMVLNVADEVPRLVHGDPIRLRQVLNNLLGNALKFTNSGHLLLEVRAAGQTSTVQEPNSMACLTFHVRDSGVGIGAEHLPHLFTAFSQVDESSTRRTRGTGLGLTISRELVELMGGRLQVESAPGIGSHFWFDTTLTLPVSSVEQTADSPDTTPRTVTEAQDVRVLVAEDNSVNQKIVRTLIHGLGWEVRVVDDGRAAVAATRRTAYHLVLMDCRRPELDGYDATRMIRQDEATRLRTTGQTARLPIIGLTANAMLGDRQLCLDAGMDDYLSKPYARADLVAMMKKCLQHRITEPVAITGVAPPPHPMARPMMASSTAQ